MTYLKIYLTDEEMAFIKEQGRGYVRSLVRDAMGPAKGAPSPEVVTFDKDEPEKEKPVATFEGRPTRILRGTCPACGGVVNLHLCGKCGRSW